MAGIRLVYVGGGSTRAPGTVASLVERGAAFRGSEVVLVDLDPERLDVVRRLTERMAAVRGLDLRVRATTDRWSALDGADVVLTSFRPGGFEARALDEAIPLRHGVIGQETQGPGGFFMALRSIAVMREIVAEMERRCPEAWLVNYTNPVNIVSEAITHHSAIRCVSLCEGPLTFPRDMARLAGLDPTQLDATLVGLNHTGWSVRHEYAGADVMPLIEDAAQRLGAIGEPGTRDELMLHLAATMGALPSAYLYYYYFADHALAAARTAPRSRSQEIMASVDDYWTHYRQQAIADTPRLDPDRSRGGIMELELAVDVIDAIVNDRGTTWPVNVPNRGSVLPGFPDDLVVEVPAHVSANGIEPIQVSALPAQVRGLIESLGAYQSLAAEAAWSGTRRDGVRAIAAHPLVLTLPTAEALYDEMAAAHSAYLPARLMV
ncbi:MAG: glycoside hydrolase [Chloroflexota bacterium]|nr:glycoside hydrolase [Chloroflexota bacterium]